MTVRPATPVRPGGLAPGTQLDASCALALLTTVSALAFSRVFTTSGWVVPVVVSALAGHAIAWGLRRARVPAAAAVLLALGAIGILGMYLVLPGDLTWGLPLGHMFHALGDTIRRAGSGIHSAVTPVPSTPGYALLIAWGTGMAAVVADLLAFRIASPLQSLAPPLALFCTGSAIGTSHGRGWTVGAEVGALVVFLLVEHLSSEREHATWLGGRTRHTDRSLATGAGVVAALAVLAAVAITPTIPSREGDGLLGWRSAPGASGGSRITPSPFDDLRVRLLNNPDTVVMTVASSEPSYWRLTSLDSFNGTVWSADDSYRNVQQHLPGVDTTPDTRQVLEEFQISALDSIWLPTGFNPEAVDNIDGVSWDSASGSLISSRPTSDGQSYNVVASQQLATLNPTELAATPALGAGVLPQDLVLPSTLPARVRQLAQQLTAGDTTEYAKAFALEQYFHKAPFYYTTDPPSDDSLDALSAFLFSTHAGYCQQFAGAYAVLARAVGLPTRIAVGFQTGTSGPNGYTVTDADAHAWPEVWFPTLGWVPFEPTPGRQVPNASYTGDTKTVAKSATAPLPSTTLTPSGGVSHASHPADTAPPTSVAKAGSSAASTKGHTLREVAVPLIIAVAVAIGWVVLLFAIRRTRWRRRRLRAQRLQLGSVSRAPRAIGGYDPALHDRATAGRVLVSWAEVAELLAWWRMRRRPDETVSEFTERAVRALRASLVDESVGRDLQRLAALVRLAEFSASALAPDTATTAETLAESIIDELRRAAPRSRRIEHLLHPRHALGAATVSSQPDEVVGSRR